MTAAEAYGSAIALTADDCEQRLVAALKSESVAWVSPVDGSMEPAIPRYGTARVVALNGHGVRRGDVVVTRDADGRCALRRSHVVRYRYRATQTGLAAEGRRGRLRTRQSSAFAMSLRLAATRTPIEQRPHGTLELLGAILRGAKIRKSAAERLMYVYDFESTPSSLLGHTSALRGAHARRDSRARGKPDIGGRETPSNA